MILSILRFFFMLVSLALLATAGWLIWSWLEGVTLVEEAGRTYEQREAWRLWLGLALIAWSLVGRFVIGLILARPDTDPSRPLREPGKIVKSPTGASLYVETTGLSTGPTIVLTHGWGLDSTIWNYAKRALGNRYRIVTWDLAGLGRSKVAPEGVSLPAFATDLKAIVDATSPNNPVTLVGHSIGGMTIQTLARDEPAFFRDRINGAILFNTTHTNPLKTIIFSPLLQALQKPVLEPAMKLAILLKPFLWLSAWLSYLSGATHIAMRFGFGKYVTRSQLDHTALLTTRNSPGVQARGNLAMFHWSATQDLPNLTGPVLVLAGDKDIVTKADASQTIAQQVPAAELQVVEGVNHMGFLERAETYNAAIAHFMAARRSIPLPA